MEQLTGACLQTQNGQPLMLLGVELTGEIRGLLFEASVKQRFCNPTDISVEVIGSVIVNYRIFYFFLIE